MSKMDTNTNENIIERASSSVQDDKRDDSSPSPCTSRMDIIPGPSSHAAEFEIGVEPNPEELDDEEDFVDDLSEESENENDDNVEDDDNDDVIESELQKKFAGPSKQEAVTKNASDAVFDEFSFGQIENLVESSECDSAFKAEQAAKWTSQGESCTALIKADRYYAGVAYPGIIKDKEKAVASLGGYKNIMQARKAKRLELKFRPDDPYCKGTVGNYVKNNHLLLRCRRRKLKNVPSTSSSQDLVEDRWEYKVEVIGVVDGLFTFKRPCDFQYLPVAKKSEGSGYREILSDIMIYSDTERQTYFSKDVPLFVPPFLFSRAERMSNFTFQNEEQKDYEHIGLARKHRGKGSQRIVYTTKRVPTEPNIAAINRFEGFSKLQVNLEPLKRLFEERPLWSKTGVVSRMKALGYPKLYNHVNMVAYYFGNGPWIHLWCRLGFDPRKDPKAKMYQTIDFRIRKSWNREKVEAKRGPDFFKSALVQGLNAYHGHKLAPMKQVVDFEVPGDNLSHGNSSRERTSMMGGQEINILYQYAPNVVPPYRQMYYQLCDIFEDEIQALAHQNDGQETECTERDGWCIPDFLARSRDIMMQHSERLMSS